MYSKIEIRVRIYKLASEWVNNAPDDDLNKVEINPIKMLESRKALSILFKSHINKNFEIKNLLNIFR